MSDLIVALAYSIQAVVFGLLGASFAYRAYKNHLGNGIRAQVFWLAGMFTTASMLYLFRITDRMRVLAGLPAEPPSSGLFVLIAVSNAFFGLMFWLAFRKAN